MDQYRVSSLVSLIAIFLIVVSTASAQSTGTVTGRITDAETDAPLPGVNVVLAELDRGAATGNDGRFTVPDVPTGRHSLTARFVGYASATRTVQVTADATTHIEIALQPESVDLTGIQVTALRPNVQPTGELQSEQIRKAEVADPGALLRDLPGVNSVRRGPMGLDPNVRGLSETEVGVYIGGMRTFPAGPARMDSPMSHVDPSTIASIDVVKGPYALTWGPGNMSAVQVTQRGEDPPRTSLTGSVRSGYDTNRNAREATVFGMGRQGPWSYSVNSAWRDGADFKAGDGQFVPGDYESTDGRGRIGVEVSEQSTLALNGSYQNQQDIDYPGRLLNADFFETGMGQLEYEFVEGNGLLQSLNVRASAQQTLHGMTNKGKPTFEAGENRPPLRIRVDSEIQTTGGRVAAELSPDSAWDLEFGGDVLWTYRDAERSLEAVMDDGSRVVPPFYRTEDGEILNNAWPGVTIAQEGLFAKGSRTVGDVLTVTGTTRLDFIQSDADDPTGPFLDHAGVTEDELAQENVALSGALTTSFPLADQWTLSLGTGSVARPPSALERYADRFPASKSQTSAEFQGTPTLNLERSVQGDVWLDGAGRGWTLSLNGFARRIDDYITLQPTDIDPILPLSPNTVFRYVNGEATFFGTELNATVSLPASLTARGSGSYLWGTDGTLGEPAFGVSPPSATFGLQWTPRVRHPAVSDVYLDGAATLVAEQDRVAATRGEELTDGYVTVDLRAGADLLRSITLEVSAENLFDVTYVNHLNAKNPFSGAQIPEPGRVVSTTLSVQF